MKWLILYTKSTTCVFLCITNQSQWATWFPSVQYKFKLLLNMLVLKSDKSVEARIFRPFIEIAIACLFLMYTLSFKPNRCDIQKHVPSFYKSTGFSTNSNAMNVYAIENLNIVHPECASCTWIRIYIYKGTNCNPLIANWFLYSMRRILCQISRNTYKWFYVIDKFDDASRYFLNIVTIDKPVFAKIFLIYIQTELYLKKKTDSDILTSFLDSSRAPGLSSGLQGSMDVHRGALLLVPQWQCISSFVFHINIKVIDSNTHISVYDKHDDFGFF